MISLVDFSLAFGDRILIEKVSTSFGQNNLTALIGRNGAGKSTLLKNLCHLENNHRGEILLNDKEINHYSRQQLSSLISIVNTSRPRIANISCYEIVALGRSPYTDWLGLLSLEDKKIINMALEWVGMFDFRNRKIDKLSDGECQRIMIARAIAQDTPILLLDEPTSFLDLPTRFEIVGLLRRLAHENGKTVIFSTHELDIALEMADYIALINDSELHNLPMAEMLKSGLIQNLFKMPGDYISRFLKIHSH